MEAGNADVTRILNAAGTGDRQAAEELIPIVYDELRKLASWRLGQEAAAHTLQATALVHEAYLKLSPEEAQWDGRKHFFSAAAEAMRRILIDRARRRKAVRHGGELDGSELRQADVQLALGEPVGALAQLLEGPAHSARHDEAHERRDGRDGEPADDEVAVDVASGRLDGRHGDGRSSKRILVIRDLPEDWCDTSIVGHEILLTVCHPIVGFVSRTTCLWEPRSTSA